jgi:ABC-type multidrug transport system fused ATPase/permease subunit
MFIILGFFVIVLAAILQAYCEFGRQARPDVKPNILKTRFRYVMEALWIILMLGAAALLFLYHWLLGVIGIVAFWVVLPFIITPIMRNRILPPWDEVKTELEPKGYNERDYWRGSWWMIESKQKRRKRQ